jgi:hypothetical protein
MTAVPRFFFSREYAVGVRRVGGVPASEQVGSIRFPVLPGACARVTLKNLDLRIERTGFIPPAYALIGRVVLAEARQQSVSSRSWMVKHDGVTYEFLFRPIGPKDRKEGRRRCDLRQDDRYVGSVKLHAGFVRYKAYTYFPHEHPYEFVLFLTWLAFGRLTGTFHIPLESLGG